MPFQFLDLMLAFSHPSIQPLELNSISIILLEDCFSLLIPEFSTVHDSFLQSKIHCLQPTFVPNKGRLRYIHVFLSDEVLQFTQKQNCLQSVEHDYHSSCYNSQIFINLFNGCTIDCLMQRPYTCICLSFTQQQ